MIFFRSKNNSSQHLNSAGFSIVEVIIALALTVVMVVVIGKSLGAILRLANTSQLKSEAYIYAQEYLELMTAFQNEYFSCYGASPCTPPDGQPSCTPPAPYTSCWVEYPINHSGVTEFYIDGAYDLQPLSGGNPESVSANPFFSRKITIQNLSRNADFELDPAGTVDFGTKEAVVTVYWTNHGQPVSFSMSTILTDWQNYAP